MGDIGWPELVMLLVVVVVLFGSSSSKLAGLGKGAGRAPREFKEETQGLAESPPPAAVAPTPAVASGADRPGGGGSGRPRRRAAPQTDPAPGTS